MKRFDGSSAGALFMVKAFTVGLLIVVISGGFVTLSPALSWVTEQSSIRLEGWSKSEIDQAIHRSFRRNRIPFGQLIACRITVEPTSSNDVSPSYLVTIRSGIDWFECPSQCAPCLNVDGLIENLRLQLERK